LILHPFGMEMPGRKYTAVGGYRYGFNGKENDNEVKGEGNQQDYGMRIYDPRLGRFLSVDPIIKEYPELTPYQFASNTPIRAIDLDGTEAVTPAIFDAFKYVSWLDIYLWYHEGDGDGSSDLDEIVSGINDLRTAAQEKITTRQDVIEYNTISNDPNSETSIEEYNGLKQLDSDLKMCTGMFKIEDGVYSLASKGEAIITVGISAPALFESAENIVGRALIKKMTPNPILRPLPLSDEIKQIEQDLTKPIIVKANRNGGQAKLRSILKDTKASSSDKGWIKQDVNQINRGKRTSIRNPPGKDLAHQRGREAAKGYSYKHSNLQTKELHKLQHKYDKNGTLNTEKPIKN
jgi:RHS repeat-associated protein